MARAPKATAKKPGTTAKPKSAAKKPAAKKPAAKKAAAKKPVAKAQAAKKPAAKKPAAKPAAKKPAAKKAVAKKAKPAGASRAAQARPAARTAATGPAKAGAIPPSPIPAARGEAVERRRKPDRATAALRFQRDLLANIVQSSQNPIMAFRAIRDEKGIADFEWLVINAAAGRLLGIGQKKLIGKGLRDTLPGKSENALFRHYIDVVESGRPFDYEQRVESGSMRAWFRVHAVKLGDGLCVTMSDITKYKMVTPAAAPKSPEPPPYGGTN